VKVHDPRHCEVAMYVYNINKLALIFFLLMSEVAVIVRSLSNNNVYSARISNDDSSFFGTILQDDIKGTTTDKSEINNNEHNNPTKNNRGYWCDYCSCGFNKRKSYIEHTRGKRHDAVITEGEKVWKEYREGHRNASFAFYDESVTKIDVVRAWSLDLFMDGLQARSRSSKKKSVVNGMIGGIDTSGRISSSLSSSSSGKIGNNVNGGGGNQIDPSIRLDDLTFSKRGALFRYLHESSSGVPGLTDMISSLPSRYVRIKELLESVEVYFHVVHMILKRSTEQGCKAKRLARVYDAGCGHGLVGMLIAATYPNIAVHSIDLVSRDSFLAHCDAFRSTGTALNNLSFQTGDLALIRNKSHDQRIDDGVNDDDDNHDDNGGYQEEGAGHTLVLCVHGCKELTHESIELAKNNKWAWLSVPCCLQVMDHLDESTSLKIKSDHTRYAILCGAIIANYHPETVSTIDSRITGRGIVLASSGKTES